MEQIKLIECPRDAMQGLVEFIPSQTKIEYINKLLKCGFHTVDFGSFVSPKAIPQLKDSAEVLEALEPSQTELLAIVANQRGAVDAAAFDRIDYLGYPFSVSEQFQKSNTNATIDESFSRVEKVKEITDKNNKGLVLYLSMGFGNPYGETWSPDIVTSWCEKLHAKLDINILAVSDTIGVADQKIVNSLFETLIPSLPAVEFGAHLHVVPQKAEELLEAAYYAGCRRFDGAIRGFGGCPMAKDTLTGNMPTEKILAWFEKNSIDSGIDKSAFEIALKNADAVFP
jgi:hydroxymethylglutaryl-CoA lyase